MKVMIAAILALALGFSFGTSWAQPECVEIYLKIVSVADPPCYDGYTVTTNWSIYVTTSPTSVSAGTCSSFTLDNAYANVAFFDGTCGQNHRFACDIVATGSTLSGYYLLTDLGGGCFRVCGNCTP